MDLTNLGISPREPKSYWVFSSRRDSMQRWEDHEPPFPLGCDLWHSNMHAKADPRVLLFVHPQPRCLGETLGSRQLSVATAGPDKLLHHAACSSELPMPMASGFVPTQRGEEGWSVSTDSLGACELREALRVAKPAPLPCLRGFASDSAELQVM